MSNRAMAVHNGFDAGAQFLADGDHGRFPVVALDIGQPDVGLLADPAAGAEQELDHRGHTRCRTLFDSSIRPIIEAMAADRTQLQSWRRFVVEGEGIPAGANRPLILDSWKRPRAFEIGPCRNCSCTSAEPQELERRKALRAELLEAAVPRLLELHKTIEGSLSLITLTDGHGVVLDVMGDDEIRVMKNLPQQGSVHSERVIGTSGRETSLAIDRQGSILKTNRVAQDNLRPDSDTIGRSVSEAVPATINFACLVAEDVAALANLRFTPEELARIDEEAVEGGTNLWAQSSEAG